MKHKINNPIKLLKETAGKFTSVIYTNKKGITHCYTVRTGVTRYLKGKGTGKAKSPNTITVFCVDWWNRGYKSFDKTRIQNIQCGKLRFRKKK